MAETIHVKLPDGSDKEVPKGTTALEIAKSISSRLADAALVAKVRPLSGNGHNPSSAGLESRPPSSDRAADGARPHGAAGNLIDLSRPLEKDVELQILTEKNPEALEVYRHSSAHLLAAAVLELFHETKLGHGPANESGYFYDFYRPTPLTPEDLEKIEKKMKELEQQNLQI
jgi:threonyl-tRNA synthetase